MVTTKEIKATLRDLGIRPNLSGFEYLADAIRIIADDPSTKITALYALLAKCYNTTHASVERCMRHAIREGLDRGDPALYDKLFSYTYTPGNYITVSLFIHTLADHFRED